jgi:hypothetical protein
MAPDPVPHTDELRIVGPDGFLSARDDACFTLHSYLNETLRRQANDPSHAHAIAAADVKRLGKELSGPQLIALVMAAFDRAAWIGEHGHEIAQSLEWGRRVAAILYHLYALRLPFAVSDMCRLIDGRDGAAPPVGRIAEYFASHELTAEACATLRRRREAYKARIGRDYKHVDVQSELQLLDMLLWHDETDALDLAACWSERVRRDYRAMSGERRRRWQSLLRHIRGDAGSKPPKPWIKEAQSRLAAVGAEDFRSTITDWFDCFRQPDPLQLSVVGSHVLKGMLWYSALARDPAVTAASLAVADAPWKPKRNLDKVMVALALVIDTMPVEEAWAALLPLQHAWGASEGRIERLVIKIAGASGISEAQLRAQGVLKPRLPPPPEPQSAQQLAVAGWRAIEVFLATLRDRPSPLRS